MKRRPAEVAGLLFLCLSARGYDVLEATRLVTLAHHHGVIASEVGVIKAQLIS